MDRIPNLHEEFKFFDDGRLNRIFDAVVTNVFSVEFAKSFIVEVPDYSDPDYVGVTKMSLYDAWKQQVECFKDADHRIIGTHIGDYWVYAPTTDKFVQCIIKDYHKDPIYFARDVNGEWFSFDVSAEWQAGLLDVSGEKYEHYKEVYGVNE